MRKPSTRKQTDSNQRSVTIVDVAELAGVSISAVSRAFNAEASCSDSMRSKVFAAADELDYKPNRLARGLKSRSNLVGIIVTDFDNPAYLSILNDFTATLQRNGYHSLLINVGTDMDMQEAVELIMEYHVDGLIVTSSALPTELVEVCHSQGTPVVIFARHSLNNPVTVVCCDNVSAGRMAADALSEAGYKKFAFIGGVEGASTTIDRQRGFITRLVELGHTNWQVIDGGRHSYDAGFEATCKLFSFTEQPDALFFADDILACGGMDAIRHEIGLQVPQQVGVIGVDDMRFASSRAYDLTTVRQPFDEMVQKSVSALLEHMNEDELVVKEITLPCELVVRGSVKQQLG
jgi:DNA-binding LacI/PurR family transcriptional regulator